MAFRFTFGVLNLFAKKHIVRKWGKELYSSYMQTAKDTLRSLEAELPHSVDRHLQADYKGIVAIVPMYSSLMQQGIARDEIEMVIWKTVESVYKCMPLGRGQKAYTKLLNGWKAYQKKGERGLLGINDWIMEIEEDGDGSYYCRVIECGAYKILKDRGYDFVFPCVCRVDHLTMNLRGFRYERDMTIGDGDDRCNNHFMGLGYAEWAPGKGFIDRK